MLAEFNSEGYLILRSFFENKSDLSPFYDQINKVGKFINPRFTPFDLFEDIQLDNDQRSNLYRSLRYLPAISQLACSEKALKLCKSLGLEFPAIMNSCNIRMDTPKLDQYLFHWHQDITYLLGSMNALTFWIPLSKVNKERGSIEVIPGSHTKGIFPIRYTGKKSLEPNTVMSPKDIYLEKEPTAPPILLEAEPGDLVVFSQLLLHRSTPNHSGYIRWAIQLRFADLMNKHFYENNYPFGDLTNIFHTTYIENKK